MRSKIADDLAMRLDEGGEVPVIVTLAPGGDVAELERSGLSVGRVFESIRAVSGTLTADAARALDASPQVERIEYDGEAHALGT